MAFVPLNSNLVNYKFYTKTPTTDSSETITFDVSDFPNYKNLTKDNFACISTNVWCRSGSSINTNVHCSSYNPSTGIVTFTSGGSGGTVSFNNLAQTIVVFG